MTSVAGEIDETLDPFAAANLSNPYRYYERLRSVGPVLSLPSRRIYLATTYEAVNAVLRDPPTFSSAQGAFYPRASTAGRVGRSRMALIRWAYDRAPNLSGRVLSSVMGRVGAGLLKRDPYPMTTPFIDTDPPLHTNNRRAVQPFFGKQAMAGAEPMVYSHVRDLVDDALAQRRIDAVGAFAVELPSLVIADFIGMRAPAQHVFDWAEAIFDMGGAEPSATTCRHAAGAYAWLLHSGTRDLPDGSMSSQIIEAGGAVDAGGVLVTTADRILGLGAIWSAALDTTTSLIGNMLDAFADHGDQWERLRANPDLAESAVEEALRFDSPIRIFFRTTTVETELCGVHIPANARVGVIFGSANRDPAKFTEPDRFDIGRKPNQHLAFGASAHLCLGAPLARLEAALLLKELASRVRTIERTGAAERTGNALTHGFRVLPLRLVGA